MPKNIFHDIVPPEKRSIRNLTITKKDEAAEKKALGKEFKEIKEIRKEEKERKESRDYDYTPSTPKAPKKGVWFIALCSFAALVFAVLFLIAKADINITAKKITLNLNDDLVASKTGSDLLYSSISFTDTDSLEVKGGEKKEVSTKAAGTAVIYNTQNVSQILIAKTRLEDGKGHIFFIDQRVVVPAQKTVSGKAVPGSVEVSITAEKAGTEYNVGLVDLTVPAFKGEAKFNSVYARVKKAIAGGASGLMPVISSEDRVAAKKTLEENLSKKILAKAEAQIPGSSIIFDGAYNIKFEEMPSEAKGDSLVLKEKATFSGFVFEKKNLVSEMAKLKKQDVFVDDSISLDSKAVVATGANETGDTLKIHLTGDLNISYTFDSEKLKEDFKNKSKTEVLSLLKNYPGIQSAEVSTYPLWKTPDNVNKINININ